MYALSFFAESPECPPKTKKVYLVISPQRLPVFSLSSKYIDAIEEHIDDKKIQRHADLWQTISV